MTKNAFALFLGGLIGVSVTGLYLIFKKVRLTARKTKIVRTEKGFDEFHLAQEEK